MEPVGRRPLIIGLGGKGAQLASEMENFPEIDTLILDTDSRTEKRFPHSHVFTVGNRLVNGEGTGGNMNLARACYKMDMESIAPLVLGRPVVFLISSMDGSTGLAGSVEIGMLLIKVGMPAFTILLHEQGTTRGGFDPMHMASVLLDGPLRPGCIVKVGSGSERYDDLAAKLHLILKGCDIGVEFHITPGTWLDMRNDGGPFSLEMMELGQPFQKISIDPPGALSLSIPDTMTTTDVRSMIGSILGDTTGIGLAMSVNDTASPIKCAMISRSSEPLPPAEGPPPDPEQLKALMDRSTDMEYGPSIDLAH